MHDQDALKPYFPWRRYAIAVLLLVILGVGAFFIFQSVRFSLEEDVQVVVEGPAEVDAGVSFPLRLILENRSRMELRDVEISIAIPEEVIVLDAGEANIIGKNLIVRPEQPIAPRGKKTVSFQFAAESDPGTSFSFRAKATFRPKTLAAQFMIERVHAIRVGSIPVSITLEFPEKVRAGEDFSFTAVLRSDTDRTIKNLRLEISPPPQFVFLEALPNPCSDKNDCWDVSELLPGAAFSAVIRGQFPEGNLDTAFHVRVGTFDLTRETLRSYYETAKTIHVEPPLFSIIQLVGQSKNPKDAAVEPGQLLGVKIQYENLSEVALENVAFRLKLEGKAVDLMSFSSSEDFVKETEGQYRWDPADVSALKFLRPGAGGEISYSFRVRNQIPFESLAAANPIIKSTIRAQTAKGLLVVRQATFRVATAFTLQQEVLFSEAPGGRNSGPIPPRVGQETTYTVVWRVFGGVNGVRNVVVRGILGPQVRYRELLEPEGALVTYDVGKHEMIWGIGDMTAGTGIFSPPREVVFRIGLTPTAADVGMTPELVSEVKATGEDVFTELFREHGITNPVKADLPDDPTVEGAGGIVQPNP